MNKKSYVSPVLLSGPLPDDEGDDVILDPSQDHGAGPVKGAKGGYNF